jgi:hypothetical protein
MIGKLTAWRGDHRKASTENMRVGGLVSIEELNAKADAKSKAKRSPSKSLKKVSCPSLLHCFVSFSLLQAVMVLGLVLVPPIEAVEATSSCRSWSRCSSTAFLAMAMR